MKKLADEQKPVAQVVEQKTAELEEWKIKVTLLEDYCGCGQVQVDISPPIAAFVLG